ncbi:MAG: ATP-binding protein, partial [Dehalococcoidia bacterium]|nr:ATP-binding protein [Dehalococcoidia bacterium]
MADLYIGKVFNPADKSLGDRFLLDSSDLTTHGIVIGMTGSGKTGLSIDIIEELLKARVPVIVIDPKGDMGNLALAFDRLAPDQFEPWVDKDEAARENKTVAEMAQAASETWTKGLKVSGIEAADVAAYVKGHRVRVFTPGASAGIPINLIDSLAAPGIEFEGNEEALRDEIDSVVTALLGFVKVQADPVSSREYILLFSLIENAWRQDQDLSLESLISQVGNPPIERVGALPMEAFYPQKDRSQLMFSLNNLVASPPFEIWRQGEPIDIESWVRSPDGIPQLSIVYTSHLDDEQRVFVTALILNKLKTWMRKQPGTSELRLLFYMDEIYGYFPPTANPPTKKPLLTLLKQ